MFQPHSQVVLPTFLASVSASTARQLLGILASLVLSSVAGACTAVWTDNYASFIACRALQVGKFSWYVEHSGSNAGADEAPHYSQLIEQTARFLAQGIFSAYYFVQALVLISVRLPSHLQRRAIVVLNTGTMLFADLLRASSAGAVHECTVHVLEHDRVANFNNSYTPCRACTCCK